MGIVASTRLKWAGLKAPPVPAPGAIGAAAIDGAEADAQAYCVGGPSCWLLDAKQLGSTSVQPFETEGLIGARTAPQP
jgi:hypothetical protein